MKKRIFIASVILTACIWSQATPGYAWEDGQVDPNTTYTEIIGKDSAEIAAEGTFKKWDPSDPEPGPNPIDPVDWVDVEVPTKVLFGQTDVTKKIIAPLYQIKNNSQRPVKVAVKDFQKGTDADKLPEMSLRLLRQDQQQEISLVDPKTAPQFPADLGQLASATGHLTFTFGGDAGPGFQFGKSIKPQYRLLLQFEPVL